jgi:hypothetical protein
VLSLVHGLGRRYGQDPNLRAELEHRGVRYVLAISCATGVRIDNGSSSERTDLISDRRPQAAWCTARRPRRTLCDLGPPVSPLHVVLASSLR